MNTTNSEKKYREVGKGKVMSRNYDKFSMQLKNAMLWVDPIQEMAIYYTMFHEDYHKFELGTDRRPVIVYTYGSKKRIVIDFDDKMIEYRFDDEDMYNITSRYNNLLSDAYAYGY